MCRVCNKSFKLCRCTAEEIMAFQQKAVNAWSPFSVQVLQGKTLAEIERDVILGVLDANAGNRTRVSEQLRISIRTVRNKLAVYRRSGHLADTV
jgi:DNA-binding NtrC family response regulator